MEKEDIVYSNGKKDSNYATYGLYRINTSQFTKLYLKNAVKIVITSKNNELTDNQKVYYEKLKAYLEKERRN